MLPGKYIQKEAFSMEKIISRIYELIKETDNLIEFEERFHLYMDDLAAELLGEVFTRIGQVIKENKQSDHWKVERDDQKTILFSFGPVTFKRTLMYDENSEARYPLDEWLGIKKYQRRSPFVNVKVAEMASESDYREVARVLSEWTAVNISHTTVGSIVKEVGNAQAEADKEMVRELEESASLPEGKKIDFLYAEADGINVRGTTKKKQLEVCHGMTYEGWDKNGERVSLRNQKVFMTTQPSELFWKEVQARTAHEYSLEQTQVVTNSDGGPGYSAEKFQEAFSQSQYPVLNQLDDYHVKQSMNRAFGWRQSEYKQGVMLALEERNKDAFILWLDTYESTLEDEKKIKRVSEFRKYILNQWDRIFDWRDKVENLPKDARGLGAMESNQRRISFRMKKRGMHWSAAGAEAMVKIKQGMLNGTLREIYLASQQRSQRKQREVKRTVRMTAILHQPQQESIGVKKGSISLYTAHTSAIGKLFKTFR